MVPAANEVNSKKGNKDYKEFVKAAGRLHVDVQPDAVQKIEKFMAEAQYQENASRFQAASGILSYSVRCNEGAPRGQQGVFENAIP